MFSETKFAKLPKVKVKRNVSGHAVIRRGSVKYPQRKQQSLTYNNEVVMMLRSIENPGPLFRVISGRSEQLDQF